MQAQVEKYIFSYFMWGTEASFLKMHSSKGHSLNQMLVLWISPALSPPCVTRMCFTGGHCLIWWRSWSLSLHWFWWLPLIFRFLAPYCSSCSPNVHAHSQSFIRKLLVLTEVTGAAVSAQRNHSPSTEKESRDQKKCPHCVIMFWLKKAFCRAGHHMQISWALT